MTKVLKIINTNHSDIIHDAKLDFYGIKLATCSSDGTVKIFDVKESNHTLKATLEEHTEAVWSVSWSHPIFGSLLATCGYDKKIIVWEEDNKQWKAIYHNRNHKSSVNCIEWAPYEYGAMLLAGSSDGYISIITQKSDKTFVEKTVLAHEMGVNAVSWAPVSTDDSLLSEGGNEMQIAPPRSATGGCDNLIRIWMKQSNEEWVVEHELQKHEDWVRDVAWAPNIGLGCDQIASCSMDGTVLVWRRSCLGDVQRMPRWEPFLLHQFSECVWHLSFNVTGNVLACSGGDNKVTLWKENSCGEWVCISDNGGVHGQGEGGTLVGGAEKAYTGAPFNSAQS